MLEKRRGSAGGGGDYTDGNNGKKSIEKEGSLILVLFKKACFCNGMWRKGGGWGAGGGALLELKKNL